MCAVEQSRRSDLGDRILLALIRQAFESGEVAAQDLVYLTDRVLVAEAQPQMYGTPGVELRSPEDEARVDANRLALGLEPLRVFDAKQRERRRAAPPGSSCVAAGQVVTGPPIT